MKAICILEYSHSQLLQAKRKREISIFVTFLAKNAIFAPLSLWKWKSTMRCLPPRKYYISLFCKLFAIEWS